jgi:alpha-tubulin suppressor-like RCC1 family protein
MSHCHTGLIFAVNLPKTGGIMGEEYVQDVPRKLVKSKRFQNVAIGPHHTLAVTNTGDLFGWGKDFVAKASSNEPAPILVPDVQFKSVACGYQHNAATSVDGQVYTWGHGGSWFSGGGQLGK